nr:hypothetical protein [uncultured Anaerobutyricum sp.]
MRKVQIKKKLYMQLSTMILCVVALTTLYSVNAFTKSEKNAIVGKVYEFDKNDDYDISESDKSSSTDKVETYGKFSLLGNIRNVSEKNGVPAYEVTSGNLDLYYTYSDALLKAEEKKWHLVADKGKKLDGNKLDKKILKGAIIIQTSKDRKNWTDIKCLTNAFDDEPVRTETLYKTTDVQILNGCYYRIIVAYKTEKLEKIKKIAFVPVKDYEYKKTAEVYEFCAYSPSTEQEVSESEQTYALGKKTRVKEFDGYSGSSEIEKKDIHYNWDIGQFFVSGFTDKVKESDGNIVFLKNVGNKVTLWFNLNQNINELNGDKDLKITDDTEGYDKYFETERTDFGKGTLIIRYTDYNNNSSEPQVYKNYLAANTSVGADTKVQLFEEGDYEVALDYEVTSDQLIDKVGHYRIFFTFSVRNGNCMVYPLDVSTGSELTNSSMTENGFMLDLAKSRYLQINVKREVLTDSANGLVEDTRSNAPAKDGEKYTEEGIYTITATNQYTNQKTTKKIYVGTNNLMKAVMTSGLSIEEINKLISEGATIDDEGTLTLAKESEVVDSSDRTISSSENAEKATNKAFNLKYLIAVVGALLVVALFVGIKHKKKKSIAEEDDEQ